MRFKFTIPDRAEPIERDLPMAQAPKAGDRIEFEGETYLVFGIRYWGNQQEQGADVKLVKLVKHAGGPTSN